MEKTSAMQPRFLPPATINIILVLKHIRTTMNEKLILFYIFRETTTRKYRTIYMVHTVCRCSEAVMYAGHKNSMLYRIVFLVIAVIIRYYFLWTQKNNSRRTNVWSIMLSLHCSEDDVYFEMVYGYKINTLVIENK